MLLIHWIYKVFVIKLLHQVVASVSAKLIIIAQSVATFTVKEFEC